MLLAQYKQMFNPKFHFVIEEFAKYYSVKVQKYGVDELPVDRIVHEWDQVFLEWFGDWANNLSGKDLQNFRKNISD